ncbi:SMI1/KNR4 family protein [Nonomuraea sp. NPDC050691]|uniref:SMI1/KNR4 family protein n=1 Tax=Nonomuraea sp. NPDC050691 TaxID=3155661 RepID=UPI0033C917EC
MIISRRVWLALAATAVAAAIVLIVHARRRPALHTPVRHEEAPARTETPAWPPAEQWPPAPVLGTPTAGDLARYAKPARIPKILQGGGHDRPAREPLDEATRRHLTRWAAAGLALCLLAAGGQLLEFTVFAKDQPDVYLTEARFGACDSAPCLSAEPEGAPYDPSEPAPGPWAVPDPDCHPPSRTLPVRAPDAKATRAVHRQWRRIERWLETNAPRSRRTLAGPAEPAAVAAVEARMGRRFPDDLRASLLRHDGTLAVKDTWGFGFLGHVTVSAQEMLDTWRGLCDIDDEDYGGTKSDPRSEWWDGRMLPIGYDGVGNHLVVDSVKRDVGETDHEGSMSFAPGGVRIRSYHALLKAVADALEQGGSIGYLKPEAVAGQLEWTVR